MLEFCYGIVTLLNLSPFLAIPLPLRQKGQYGTYLITAYSILVLLQH